MCQTQLSYQTQLNHKGYSLNCILLHFAYRVIIQQQICMVFPTCTVVVFMCMISDASKCIQYYIHTVLNIKKSIAHKLIWCTEKLTRLYEKPTDRMSMSTCNICTHWNTIDKRCGYTYDYTYDYTYGYTYDYTYDYTYGYTYDYTYGYTYDYTCGYTYDYTYDYTYGYTYDYTYGYTCGYTYGYRPQSK